MLSSKKGAAILQVLLVAAILAGVSALLLRSSLSRTSSARQTRRTVAAQLEIEACMAQVNELLSVKAPEAFTRDMAQCMFYCRDHNNPVTMPQSSGPIPFPTTTRPPNLYEAVYNYSITCDGARGDAVREFWCPRPASEDHGDPSPLPHRIRARMNYKDPNNPVPGDCVVTYEIQEAQDL